MVKGVGEEVILFLHGVGGGADSWAGQLKQFSQKYMVGAWDMPGYGRSRAIKTMTFPLLADSLERLLDDRGWEKVHLVGHSMGGMVAQEFAVLRQNRLHSLTLVATSPAFGNSAGSFQKNFIEARLGPLDAGGTMAELAEIMIGAMMPEGVDPTCRAFAHCCMAKIPEQAYRAAVECIVTFEQRENLSRLYVPTMVLSGQYDKIATADMMKKMASKILNCQFSFIQEAGHLSYIEDPEGFNSALGNFLLTVRA